MLLGTTMWLARVRDLIAEEIDLAPTEGSGETATIMLRRAGMEAFRDGLGRAVAILDGLTVDPTQIRSRASGDAMPASARLQ